MSESLRERIRAINSQQFVFFSRGDNIHNLNRVVLYVLKNEHTSRIKVVTVVGDGDEAPRRSWNGTSGFSTRRIPTSTSSWW